LAEKAVSRPATANPARTPRKPRRGLSQERSRARDQVSNPVRSSPHSVALEALRASGESFPAMNSPAWWYPQGHPHKGDLKRAELLLGPSIRHQEQCHALRKTSPQADLSLPISNQLFDMGIKGRGNNVLPISRIGWNIDGIQPFGRIGVDSVFCIGPRIAKVIPMRRPTPQHGVGTAQR